MRFLILASLLVSMSVAAAPRPVWAAGGIYASGGGTKTAGQNFTITVRASGVEFDSLEGRITVSGPVSVVSFNAGSGTWLPGKSPSNGNTFVGITSKTSSLTVATIVLRGTSPGSGAVSVTGAKLAKSGSIVSTVGGGTSFTIVRAPTPPGGVNVASSTHPDQSQSYEARTITLSWDKPSQATGFSYLLDQSADTTPNEPVNANTSITYENRNVGTYYFHIRAKNNDGFGPTTHFKITIKEAVDGSLAKAAITGFGKTETFATDLTAGTLSGFTINGRVPATFVALLTIAPAPTLPEGKTLTVESDETGAFSYLVDFPIKSGFYTMTVQGKKDQVVSPQSESYRVELAVARGGSIRFITDKDKQPRNVSVSVADTELKSQLVLGLWVVGSLLFFAAGAGAAWWYVMVHRQRSKKGDWLKKPPAASRR